MCPGVQVFDGLSRQVLFVQLSVDLRQLWHPEPVTVLPQDLPDATLDLLRVIGLSFPRAEALIQIQGCWKIGQKKTEEEKRDYTWKQLLLLLWSSFPWNLWTAWRAFPPNKGTPVLKEMDIPVSHTVKHGSKQRSLIISSSLRDVSLESIGS